MRLIHTMHVHIWPKRGPSCDTEESLEIPISHWVVDQLSPHHDSQFLAFSTEVLSQVNRKHNHSSSPFTSLANRAECRIAIAGAGQPNYWPKTWFRANAYKAKLATPKYTVKVVRTLLATQLFPYRAPGKFKPGYILWNNHRSRIHLWKDADD